MSIKLMAEAWGTSGLTTAQKVTLLCICDFANDEGYCWPRIKTIADKCDIGERAVQYNISHLVKLGIIEVNQRFNSGNISLSNLYRVTLRGGEKDCTIENTMGCRVDRVHSGAPGGAQPCTTIEPSYNHQKPILSENLFSLEEMPFSVQHANESPYCMGVLIQSRFEEFWSLYPRKDCKCNAKKAWEKIAKKKWKYDVEAYIINSVINQLASPNHLGKKDFLPHAATWLNQERWLDEVQTELEEFIK